MSCIGNVIWFVLGGVLMGLAWWFFGLLAFVSIVGIPWGRACFVLGRFAFFPFGSMAIARDTLTGRGDIGTSIFGTVGNVIWFILGGVWIAIGHVTSAALCAVTIIGIPFAWQHLKLAGLALCPIGMTVVPGDVADAALREAAQQRLKDYR